MLQRVRYAVKEDLHQVTAIYHQIIKTEDGQFVWDILGQHIEEVLIDQMQKNALWVVESEGVGVVGWSIVLNNSSRFSPPGVGEVYIWIAPCYQGNGLGRGLMQHMCDQLGQKGMRKLVAMLYEDDVVGQKLYKGTGFRYVGTMKAHVSIGMSCKNVVIVEKHLIKE
ncbi:MAG: GNAT family N-acetyltransferase [Cellulosilyticaceae bacterium]